MAAMHESDLEVLRSEGNVLAEAGDLVGALERFGAICERSGSDAKAQDSAAQLLLLLDREEQRIESL